MLVASLAHAANEDDYDYRNTFEQFSGGLEEVSQNIEEGAEAIELPTYVADENSDSNQGETAIVGAIRTFLDFFKLIIAPLAVLFMVVQGVRMVAAGKENEEAISNAKNYISYSIEGLLIIFVSDSIVNVIFGPEGSTFREGDAGVQEAARNTANLLQGMYSLVQVVITSIAVFVLVTAGMRYVGGSYSDDQIATAKKQITWALVGLFVIAISEFVAKDILFQSQGTSLGIDNAQLLFAQVTNFIAGTIGTLSFAFLLYAGYLYVTARENEENVAKAKKIIFGAVLGILLAAAAFAITNTLVELDASR